MFLCAVNFLIRPVSFLQALLRITRCLYLEAEMFSLSAIVVLFEAIILTLSSQQRNSPSLSPLFKEQISNVYGFFFFLKPMLLFDMGYYILVYREPNEKRCNAEVIMLHQIHYSVSLSHTFVHLEMLRLCRTVYVVLIT